MDIRTEFVGDKERWTVEKGVLPFPTPNPRGDGGHTSGNVEDERDLQIAMMAAAMSPRQWRMKSIGLQVGTPLSYDMTRSFRLFPEGAITLDGTPRAIVDAYDQEYFKELLQVIEHRRIKELSKMVRPDLDWSDHGLSENRFQARFMSCLYRGDFVGAASLGFFIDTEQTPDVLERLFTLAVEAVYEVKDHQLESLRAFLRIHGEMSNSRGSNLHVLLDLIEETREMSSHLSVTQLFIEKFHGDEWNEDGKTVEEVLEEDDLLEAYISTFLDLRSEPWFRKGFHSGMRPIIDMVNLFTSAMGPLFSMSKTPASTCSPDLMRNKEWTEWALKNWLRRGNCAVAPVSSDEDEEDDSEEDHPWDPGEMTREAGTKKKQTFDKVEKKLFEDQLELMKTIIESSNCKASSCAKWSDNVWFTKYPMEMSLPARIVTPAGLHSDRGHYPTAMHRFMTDKAIFRSRRRALGGAILIDVSGSMSISNEQIHSFIREVPAAVIAIYSADYSNNGYLRLVAEKGRAVDKWVSLAQTYKESYGQPLGPVSNNGIDGPALRWLAKQDGRKFWISDGWATSGEGCFHSSLARECRDMMKRHSIMMLPDLNEALKKIKRV